MMHHEFIQMHIYHLNEHRWRAQLPYINSIRSGWLMAIPAPSDPSDFTSDKLVTSSEKFPIA
jgi:hypothetical protein